MAIEEIKKIQVNSPITRLTYNNAGNTDSYRTHLSSSGEPGSTPYDKWCDYITRDNPIVESAPGEPVNDEKSEFLQGHFVDKINAYKECFIWKGGLKATYKNDDTSWRKAKSNGFMDVSKKVKLFLDETKISYKYNHTISIKDPVSELIEGNKIIKGFKTVVDTARAWKGDGNTEIIHRFQGAPIYEKTSQLSFNGQLKFDFHFGDFGLFSGLDEVVKPIIALASMFALKPADVTADSNYQGFFQKGTATVRPPFPTMNKLIAIYLGYAEGALAEVKSAFDGFNVNEIVNSVVNNLSEASANPFQSAITAATNLEKALMGIGARGVQEILNDSRGEYNMIHIQIGHFNLGPCIIKNVDYEFDTEMLDEQGWPSKGSISLSGIETVETATSPLVISSAFKIPGEA